MSSSEQRPDPREKLKAIRESFKAPIEKAREGVREAHRVYREAIRGDALNEAEIRRAARAWADQMAEEAILRAKRTRELEAGMTPEQREQMERTRAEVRKRVKETVAAVKNRLGEKREADRAKKAEPRH